MSALADLQRSFFDHVRSNGEQRLPAQRCVDGVVPATLGLSIYANAYRARLRESLENDHAVLAMYLGDALWTQLCERYIDAHPSRHRSLRHFGESVPPFLSANLPFSALPLVAELAAFERLLLDVFDAGDAPCAAWSDMLALAPSAWPSLRFMLHPSHRMLTTQTNAVAVWQALKVETDPPAAAAAPTPAVSLWRDDQRISRFRSVAADEQAALLVLRDGGDFAALCAALMPFHAADDVPVRAIGLLQTWFGDGLVAAIETVPSA